MAQPIASDQVAVRDNADAARYEALLDGELAGIVDYRDRGGRRILVHTRVLDAFKGRGIGNRLAAGTLQLARADKLRIVPRCPFIRAYMERHPEYRDLLGGEPLPAAD